MMSEKSKQHVEACRFCWMCHHICPIGNATGLERNTARARALGLSLVNRGAVPPEDAIDNVYECACCGACTKECVTGWDPVLFVKEARLDAALSGRLPEYIGKLTDNCLETGNAYGETEIDGALREAMGRHGEKTDLLLFLGVDAVYRAPHTAVNVIRVLEKAGVSFTVLEKEPPSGQQLEYLIGAARETKEQMEACAAAVNDFARVVAFDPQDAGILKREYGEWGVELTAQIVTFPAYAKELLKSGALTAAQTKREVVCQDPFQLARNLGETDEVREVIGAFAVCGEMLCHGRDTMWAGNLLMREWMPEAMTKVAKNRIENAKSVHADTIVTASVSEYASLKAVEQDEVKITALEELILGE
ncbi:MAG: (Fe-S)-binding protein [bacterium]|nr:(Fe-S)-binding protein [bacterium]